MRQMTKLSKREKKTGHSHTNSLALALNNLLLS